MKNDSAWFFAKDRTKWGRLPGRWLILFVMLLMISVTAGVLHADEFSLGMVPSKDGTLISYEIFGSGEPIVVFVHGWSCDSRYWRAQVPCFSEKYSLVLVDLAGHGHSGSDRSRYTMKSFGEDVQAVVEKVAGESPVILVGHSMGGHVIAEAARLMPERVIGLVGVDTLENIEYSMTREEILQITDPFRKDFAGTCHGFVKDMLLQESNEEIKEWIMADMAAASPDVAISAMEEMFSLFVTGNAAAVFEEIPIPVVNVHASLWPVDHEANRRHMSSFHAIILENTDHFLMLTDTERFNSALEEAIERVIQKADI